MSELRYRTEVWVQGRSFLVVSSTNQHSTRLSHEDLVGVKCNTKRGWFFSHHFTAGVLRVEALSSTQHQPLLRRRVQPSNSARSASLRTISTAIGDGIPYL